MCPNEQEHMPCRRHKGRLWTHKHCKTRFSKLHVRHDMQASQKLLHFIGRQPLFRQTDVAGTLHGSTYSSTCHTEPFDLLLSCVQSATSCYNALDHEHVLKYTCGTSRGRAKQGEQSHLAYLRSAFCTHKQPEPEPNTRAMVRLCNKSSVV